MKSNNRMIVFIVIIVIALVSCKKTKMELKTNKNVSNECNQIEVKKIYTNEGEDIKFEKPIIYLYPEKKTQISIKIDYAGELLCTYPYYKDGWEVIAEPNGRIHTIDGKEYSYLFWEGKSDYLWNIDEGFVVKGSDTAEFLQESLEKIGLIPKEYNEFIVYWLPKMQNNEYNLIYFAGEEYEELAKLSIEPTPDNIVRVFMVYKELNEPIEVTEQKLKSFERSGFTVIEWGGTEINE